MTDIDTAAEAAMTDIDTLRRHREALRSQCLPAEVYARGLRDEAERAHWRRVADALAWSLAKLDEEIALEEETARAFGREVP